MADFFPIESYADLQKYYPYLDELIGQYPYRQLDLEPGTHGYIEGTRYFPGAGIPSVTIDPDFLNASTLGHEYSHLATDLSPNWSYIIDPGMQRLNKPSMALNYPASMGQGFGDLYPRHLQFEEGAVRQVAPDLRRDAVSASINRHPENYFNEEQRNLLKSWRNFLQYGPSVGSLRGGESSGVVVDPTWRGTPVRGREGKISTEMTMTFEDNGVYYNIPTLFRGRRILPDLAFEMFKRGQLPAVGMAGTKEEAESMAEERSKMLDLEIKRGDLGAMRGKGDYDKLGNRFAPPPRKPKADEIREPRKRTYSNDSTGKKEPEPQPYGWSDMVYYP